MKTVESMLQHISPLPWTIRFENGEHFIKAADGSYVAHINPKNQQSPKENRTLAKIICQSVNNNDKPKTYE